MQSYDTRAEFTDEPTRIASTKSLDESISIHIFSASATMVGVCLTGIGIVRVIEALRNVNGVADNLLAVDAVAFLISCLLSYTSLRSRNAERGRRIEIVADRIFLTALVIMAFITSLIAYEIT